MDPRLFCQESESGIEGELIDEKTVDHVIKGYVGDLEVEDHEYMQMLVDKEISFGFNQSPSLMFDRNWIKCARSEAVSWILKTRAIFGFRLQTAYLSMAYFDRFLSRRSIDSDKSWAVKLLSVACLSLAAKMEEIAAPSLTDFEIEEYSFGSKLIQRMELLVLNTLEWRMIFVTPFNFINFFIVKLVKDLPSRDMVSKIVACILALMKEANLIDYRPSNIAAAATFVALDQSLTRETMESAMYSISGTGLIDIEGVFQCYSLMQKLKTEKQRRPTAINTPDLLPTQLKAIEVVENSFVSSSDKVNKRKRLTFNDAADEQDHQEKRPR